MADEQEAPKPEKKGSAKLIIILVVVLAAGGGGAYFAMGRGEASKAPPPSGHARPVGPLLEMDSFIVNLDEPGATRYLKIGLELELTRPLTEAQRKLLVRLRDRIIVYLSGLKVVEIQRPKAKAKLRKKLLGFANEVYGAGAVEAVYFKSFVMQ